MPRNVMRFSLPGGRRCMRSTVIRRRSARGDLLFVSGQVGSREDGSPEPVFEKQVQLAFDNLAAVLKAAGCTFNRIYAGADVTRLLQTKTLRHLGFSLEEMAACTVKRILRFARRIQGAAKPLVVEHRWAEMWLN
jgi:hypothetical protein